MAEENETRNMEGVIAYWTKEVREEATPTGPLNKLAFHLQDAPDKEWHELFSENKESLEKLKDEAPRGSKVKFEEYKTSGSNKWFFKPGTFVVLEKGSGFSGKKGGYRDYPSKEERQEKLYIEARTAAHKMTVDLIIAGKVDVKDLFEYSATLGRRIIGNSETKEEGE